MTNNIIGEKELSTESRLKSFEDKLDQLIANLLIPTPKISNNIEDVISLSYEQLSKISPDECSIFSYQLKQYAYYIQQRENRYRNVEKWANECLRRVYGMECANYGNQYTKYEERMNLIIYHNTYASKLHQIAMEYGAYANELNMLSNRMLDMSRTLYEIRGNKKINE